MAIVKAVNFRFGDIVQLEAIARDEWGLLAAPLSKPDRQRRRVFEGHSVAAVHVPAHRLG